MYPYVFPILSGMSVLETFQKIIIRRGYILKHVLKEGLSAVSRKTI